jgi:hypothetical protein
VHGILGKLELINEELVMGDHADIGLSPTQMRAARALGREPRSYVEIVLGDELAQAELRARLDGE